MSSDEFVDLVDEKDHVVGLASRRECHGNPKLIHRAVHVLLLNGQQQLLLQKRSSQKDIQPGKWDSSVGGHLELGEDYRTAALREMYEELGVKDIPLTKLYRSKIRNLIEAENILTFMASYEGPINFAVDEIEGVRFWTGAEIDAALGSGCFTPNFEDEWQMFNRWLQRYQSEKGKFGLCSGDSFPDLFCSLTSDQLD